MGVAQPGSAASVQESQAVAHAPRWCPKIREMLKPPQPLSQVEQP